VGHGRDITWTVRAKDAPGHIREAWLGTSWIIEVVTTGLRDGKPFKAKHLFLTSLRTTPDALLRLVRDRWSIEPVPVGGVSIDQLRHAGRDARHW
jgi:hypothetical protein